MILAEVLQGFENEQDYKNVRKLLTSRTAVELGGREIAIPAARNFRALGRLAVTVRKTIDTAIATRCIESGYELLGLTTAGESSFRVAGFRPPFPSALFRVPGLAGLFLRRITEAKDDVVA